MAWVATVLRSGGDFKPEHVERLANQLRSVGHKLFCFSDLDVPNRIPLEHGWPRWWAKMELFRPGLSGDILHIDLDSTVIDNLFPLLMRTKLTMLQDFYRPKLLASGVMLIPQDVRDGIWSEWIKSPERWMREHRTGGDQSFIGSLVGNCATWQYCVPGAVVSYKVHVRESNRESEKGTGTVPKGARLICFHGKPRPWAVEDVAAVNS